MKMRSSLKVKMILTFSVLLLISCLLISVILYHSSMNLVKESVGKQASTIVENVTKVINAEQYMELDIASSETSYYIELREELNKIREMNEMTYLYTMKRVENGAGYDYYYMVDGMPLGSEDASALGEKEESVDEFPSMKRVFETGHVEY